MAQWFPKTAAEIVVRRWSVPVACGDSLSSIDIDESGVTVDLSGISGNDACLVLSGGTSGATATVEIIATTSTGLVYVETFYLPIRASENAFGYTARDIGQYALRKIVGNGNTAEAVELDDVLERLSDMLASWAGQGADLGVKLPVTANDTLYIPDEFAWGVKNNLIVAVFSHYGEPIPPETVMYARQGLQQIKMAAIRQQRLQERDSFPGTSSETPTPSPSPTPTPTP